MRVRGLESGRADDNEATMRARLKTFKKHADAVVSYFRDSKRLIEIDAEDKVDSVFYETSLALRARGIFPGLHKDGEEYLWLPEFLKENLIGKTCVDAMFL